MRKIVTAVSAAALSLSMLASAVPALAVTGYDSAYAGESAFVNISPGQTLNFQVFFANTGTTTWSRGTGTQVDLAACLDDKTTCNAQDAAEASWNSGWLSSTRYASTVQTTTAPGALGTFSYNIAAPAGVTAGTYRFNGDLVLSSTGEKIHPEGYFQDATVGGTGGGATITSLTPNNGTNAGGTSVVIAGSGFVCTPAFPSVSFGGTNASVTSCGSTSATAVSPAHATGAVTVTLTNSGGIASNGLTYTYNDSTAPQFTGQATTGNFVTVTYSEPVCRIAAAPNPVTDWTVRNVSAGAPIAVSSDSTPVCDSLTAPTNAATTGTLILASAIPPGAFVEVTLNSNSAVCQPASVTSCDTNYRDVSGNNIRAPQSQTATAGTPETTAPTITSASAAVNSTVVTVNFSEPVYCNNAGAGVPASWTLDDNNGSTTNPTVLTITGCGASQGAADNAIALNTSTGLLAGTSYNLSYAGVANETQDIAGNDLAACVTCVSFTTGAADFTPPTLIDSRMNFNAGPSTNFVESGDAFSTTFSEKMAGTAAVRAVGTISVQDQDGTTATINCTLVAAAIDSAACVFDTTITTISVTVDAGGLTTPAVGNGTTPGLQIPFNITAMTGFTDAATPGNPPNVLGSPDRLVDYE